MSYGFTVTNDNGKTIADSREQNLYFFGKGTLHIPVGGAPIPYAPGGTINFYKSPYPLVELNGRIYLAGAGVRSGDFWSPRGNSNAVSGSLTYYSFGPVAPSPNPMGIEVFDASGRETFNSHRPPLKVLGSYYSTAEATAQAGTIGYGHRRYAPFSVNANFPQNADIAFALGNVRAYDTAYMSVGIDETAQGTFERYFRAMRVSGRNLDTSLIFTYRQNSSSFRNWNKLITPAPMSILLADVSGL